MMMSHCFGYRVRLKSMSREPKNLILIFNFAKLSQTFAESPFLMET